MIKKLIKIQGELKAPKNQFNKFGKYNYRSAEDILEAVKPLLKKYDLAIILQDEIINVGNRYYVQATVILQDPEGNTLTTTAQAREEENKKGMDSMQLTGATSSYARKYALNGMFAIDDTKDSDSTNTHGKATPKPEPQTTMATPAQIAEIESLSNIAGYTAKIKKNYPDLKKIDADTADKIINRLNVVIEEQKAKG